jgi:hypothetical protein
MFSRYQYLILLTPPPSEVNHWSDYHSMSSWSGHHDCTQFFEQIAQHQQITSAASIKFAPCGHSYTKKTTAVSCAQHATTCSSNSQRSQHANSGTPNLVRTWVPAPRVHPSHHTIALSNVTCFFTMAGLREKACMHICATAYRRPGLRVDLVVR